HNHTRFLVLAREAVTPPYDPEQRYITSMVFQVQNNPAALYKALGGFATNGVNLAKLESYQDEQFKAARFYSEVEGHPDAPAMQEALKMMQHDTVMLRLLGTYPAHEFRNKTKE
ncbi:MAG: prephenate dehydratase, partial [Alphaproteobacteria bacterium]|nr:prephenate dehydratase [Alphaproteobacteria bacterium]